jgi:hypothetical protein
MLFNIRGGTRANRSRGLRVKGRRYPALALIPKINCLRKLYGGPLKDGHSCNNAAT